MINEIAEILGVHRNSYFNYKKQERPIIFLLEKYFTKEDLEEFLNTGKIEKFEEIKQLKNKSDKILDKFFFEHYSKKPQNSEFSDYIFPEFLLYIENLSKEREIGNAKRKHDSSNYITKYHFFDFIINFNIDVNRYSDGNFKYEIKKAWVIEIISDLDEIEFFIIVTQYYHFLTKVRSAFLSDFFPTKSLH